MEASPAGPAFAPAGKVLSLRGLRKSFGAARALDGADLEIAPGEIHALVGENGAGKSTMMNILAGAFAPDGGEMVLDGKPWRPLSPADASAAGIAFIHQELALAPHLTVEENITLGVESRRFGVALSRAGRVRDILASLGREGLDPGALVARLSTADRQIVEIARALYREARVLLLDEPTSSLPRPDAERLFETLRGLRSRGRSLVYISHFLDEVSALCDRISVLRDGRTAAAGLPGNAPHADILRAMVGRPVTEVFPPRPAPAPIALDAPPALRVRGLRLRRDSPGLDLDLVPGRILGLAGLVGSGRSSLLRALAGLGSPLAGQLDTARGGADATRLDPRRSRALGLGFVCEDRKEEGLALRMSIRANATLSTLRRFASRIGILDGARENAAVESLAAVLRLRHAHADQAVGELSGGNQQKVALGRLLLEEADIWLLDEPTRGMDVGARAEIYRLAAEAAARGKAILWAGSYLPELLGVCDDLAVMHRGVLSPVRPAAQWTGEMLMTYAAVGARP